VKNRKFPKNSKRPIFLDNDGTYPRIVSDHLGDDFSMDNIDKE